MGQIVAIAQTALRRFIRDRANWFFVFIFPMLLVGLIGISFSDAGGAGRVTVVGEGQLATSLTATFEDQGLAVTSGSDAEEAQTRVARGRTDAAVIVNAAAEASWAGGEATTVEILPGSQATGQAAVQSIETGLSNVADAQTQQQALVAAGMTPADADAALARVGDVGPTVEVVTVGEGLGEEFAGLGRFDLGAAEQLSLFVFLASLAGATFLIDSRKLGVTGRELGVFRYECG